MSSSFADTQPEIRIADYNTGWPDRFRSEAGEVSSVLGGHFEEIHHIGSTAVPGLAAKPLIDILVAVRSLQPAACYSALLEPLAYRHFEVPDPGRLLFIKGSPRTHHLHVAETGGWHYWRFLLFRDCLRADPEVARAYEALKRTSAALHPNSREEYTLSKTDFITSTVARLLRARPALLASLRAGKVPLPDGL